MATMAASTSGLSKAEAWLARRKEASARLMDRDRHGGRSDLSFIDKALGFNQLGAFVPMMVCDLAMGLSLSSSAMQDCSISGYVAFFVIAPTPRRS